jgi:ketosteroid isomerase-like protein
MTALQLVDRAMDLLLAHDMAGFAGLWAVDGTMEFPFAPAGYPQRLEGRAAVAEYLRDYTDHVDLRAITSRTVHQTLDPDVVVVEFEVDGTAVRTGRPYRMRYISVITVRDGEIAGYRDYWSPLAVAEAVGGAEELAAFGGDR